MLGRVLTNHAGFSAACAVLAKKIERACSELDDPAQAAALLEKLQQIPPKAVDFAAATALWAEVQTISRNTQLSDWLKAYVHIMAQYCRFAAKKDDAALAAWLVKPSRVQVQPAFVLAVALSSGELRARLELDDTFELKWDFQNGPTCPLLLRLRETKLSYRDFMEGAKQLQTAANVFGWTVEVANPGLLTAAGGRLKVEGIVTVAGSRPQAEVQERYGSSSKGKLLPLKHLAGSSIQVTLA